MLKLAENLSLPVDAVTQTIAIIAKRRAGKSYTARRFAEELFRSNQQIVIVDPKGDWWGVRSSADGKSPGLPVVILGGEHGDVPLESNSGEVVAKLIVEERVSVLLDLSFFRKYEVAQFMAIFLETLYRLKAKEQYRTPVMLVIDEADAIAPQKPQKGEERMLGAAEDIVRRGGQRGLGCLLVTQRSAVLNKNVLTQSQIIVALRTIAPQDIAALDAWIEVHGTEEERKTLLASIASLPTGDAWFWSPGWPGEHGIFKRVHVLPITTFDSGATPKPGEKRIQPKNLADVDLDALKRQMAATIEKAKADDPRELKKKIADLERQLKQRPTEKIAEPIEVKVPVINEAQFARIVGSLESVTSIGQDAIAIAKEMTDFLREIRQAVAQFKPIERRVATHQIPAITTAAEAKKISERALGMLYPHAYRGPDLREKPRPRRIGVTRHNGAAPSHLPIGEKAILTAVIQHGSVQRDQLSVLTGYRRSSRDAYIQRLQTKNMIQISSSGIEPTAEGSAALIDVQPLPIGDELRDYWLQRLPMGEKTILQEVIKAYPDPIARETLDKASGYKRSSRDAYIQRLQSRRLVESVGRGEIRASEVLFA